jgi:hypothetical protein
MNGLYCLCCLTACYLNSNKLSTPNIFTRGKTFGVFYVDAFAKFAAAALYLLYKIGR